MVARRPSPRVRPRRGDSGSSRRTGRASTRVVGKPGRGREPRWSPDGHRLAFLSRRRGWSQVWVIDAPVPRRGRPANEPKPPRPVGRDRDRASTSTRSSGRPTAAGSRSWPGRRRRTRRRRRSSLVDVATGRTRDRRRRAQPATSGRRWLRRRVAPVRVRRRRLVPGRPADRRRPRSDRPDGRRARARRAVGRRSVTCRCRRRTAVGSSTSRSTTASRTSSSASSAAAAAETRPRPTAEDAPDVSARPRRAAGSIRGTASGGRSAGSPTARGSPRSARARPRRRTCGCCRCPGVAPGRRPAAAGHRLACRPSCGRRWRPIRVAVRRADRVQGPRRARASRARCGGRRGAPASAAAAASRPIVYPHGGPTGQSFRTFQPFKQLLTEEGFAVLDVDFRGSTGYGRAFRQANHGEWGHADVHDVIDGGPLGGRAAVVGRAAGHLRRRRTAATSSCARSSRSRRCGGPASTCSATPRSPRAIGTATGTGGSTCTG